jgi:hypothetical protein
LADHSGFAKACLLQIAQGRSQLVTWNRCQQGAAGLGINQQGLMRCIGLPLELNPPLQ